MRISTLRKVVKHQISINNFVRTKIAKLRSPNYDEYVKISPDLHPETYNCLQGVKSTIGNYLKKGNYEVTFDSVYKEPQKVLMNLYLKEHPISRMIYNFFEMAHDKPIKLNKEDIFINLNPSNKDEAVPPARKVFDAILGIFKSYDELLNKNLKKG